MRIFAHKGLWKIKKEANTLEAMNKALDAGFDLETDIRIQNGRFVIKHDPALQDEDLLNLKEVLTLFKKYDKNYIALHFKENGWGQSGQLSTLVNLLAPFSAQVFLFDISLNCCQELKELNKSIKTRVSVGDKK